MTWKLFIDDEREPPRDGSLWTVARNMDEVKSLVTVGSGFPSFISFDHDLGHDQPTGYDIVKYLVDLDLSDSIHIPKKFDFYVHSHNPIGKKILNPIWKII